MENSKIEWCAHTWNPWWGCNEIAPECGTHGGGSGFCYAAVFASRGIHPVHAGTATGGKWTGKISRSSKTVWDSPRKWRSGRVFTCSMSDFFHEDVPLQWLAEALAVIEATPNLTYQILTKRPGNIARKLEALGRTLPANVWLGITLGHAKNIPLLKPFLRVRAKIHFLSCEPLLTSLAGMPLDGIDWVIGGGQSGRSPVPTNAAWVRELRDMCVAASVPFFFKQWGTWLANPTPRGLELDDHAKGGATLDGRLWREFPV